MDRYENLRAIAEQLTAIASRIRISKGDFEATEFELVEYAEDAVDDAVSALRRAAIG